MIGGVVGCPVQNHEPDPALSPFAELMREHREIEARAAQLDAVAAELMNGGDAARALASLEELLAYFDGPAALHNADEERSLFPLLRAHAAFAQMLPAFQFQHQMNDSTQAELRAALAAGDPQSIVDQARRFAEMQRAHIMAEERALFPLAAQTLSAPELDRLSENIAARRRASAGC